MRLSDRGLILPISPLLGLNSEKPDSVPGPPIEDRRRIVRDDDLWAQSHPLVRENDHTSSSFPA